MALFIVVFIVLVFLYFLYLFYPQQQMSHGIHIPIQIPDPKYHNDCLHPCVRYVSNGFLGHKWWMIQSPYFNRNSKIENPLLFFSDDEDIPTHWTFFCVVTDTPKNGYNSDPNLFIEENKLWVFWRECFTENCTKLGVDVAVFGKFTEDGKNFSEPILMLSQNDLLNQDMLQSPVLMKIRNKYCFFTVHYEYKPRRKNKSVLVWESNSLIIPNFQFKHNCNIQSTYTCDKLKQVNLFGALFFIPKPLKHDIWHIDLFFMDKYLYLVSVSEWGDNLIISKSTDCVTFTTSRIPLLNNHAIEMKTKERTYFYKPTVVIHNKLLLFYTVTKNNSNHLYLTYL